MQKVCVAIKIFCTTVVSEKIVVKARCIEYTTQTHIVLYLQVYICHFYLLITFKDEGKEESQIINLVASGKQSKRINPDDLMIGKIVGEGSFGTVYRGMYKGMYDVAIKKVKQQKYK